MPKANSKHSPVSASSPGYTPYTAVPQNLHDGEVYYPCDVESCNSMFRRPSDWRRHKKTHHDKSGLKPCPECGALMRPDAIDGHIRARHNGEKAWPCPTCGFPFAFKESRLKHRKKEHGYQPAQYRPRQTMDHEASTSARISKARGKELATKIPRIDDGTPRSLSVPEPVRAQPSSEPCETLEPPHRAAIRPIAIQPPTWNPIGSSNGISRAPIPPLYVPGSDPVWGAASEAFSRVDSRPYLASNYQPATYIPITSHISTTTVNSFSWYQATRPVPSPANWHHGGLGQDVTRWRDASSRDVEAYDPSLEMRFTSLALSPSQNL